MSSVASLYCTNEDVLCHCTIASGQRKYDSLLDYEPDYETVIFLDLNVLKNAHKNPVLKIALSFLLCYLMFKQVRSSTTALLCSHFYAVFSAITLAFTTI